MLDRGNDEKNMLNIERNNNELRSKDINKNFIDERDEKMFNQLKIDNLFNSKNSDQYNSNQNKNININNKRSQSRPKTSKKQDYIGREDKVDADHYYRVKDENEQLKKSQQTLNNDIKRLNAALEKVKYDVLVERRLADRKVIHVEGGFDVEAETIKLENDKLKEKISKMTTIIQGLQTQKANTIKPKKSLMNAKTQIDKQNSLNEYLTTINFLREQLKNSQNEINRLHAEMHGPNKHIKNTTEYTKDLRDKSEKLAEVSTKYEKTQMQFETNIKILEHTKQSLDEYIARYNEERRKNLDLENRIQLMDVNLAKLPEYVNLIEEYKVKEKQLESTIRQLCENPFIKEAEERGNIYRKAQENELSLNEANRRLRSLEEANRNYDRENKQLKDQLMSALAEKERFKEDAMRYKISNEEREKYSKDFDEQIKLMGQYGEVDSNLTKILNVLKIKDDNSSWMKMDFLNKVQDPNNIDPLLQSREIEKLKIEKGVLGSELEKTKSLLQIQQQINEDQQKVFEEDKKIFKHQIDKLIKKCEELSKLVDIERLPKEYIRYKNLSSSHDKVRDMLLNDVLIEDRGINILSDAITEFSRDETDTDFGLNENCLDIYIGEAIFELGLEKEIGFKISNMMSFCSVDFYLHESQLSNLCSGSKPLYNLQISFKIIIDENFLTYLECDYIVVDIYYVQDNIQAILGKGKIPLSQILESEYPSDNKIINTYSSPNQVPLSRVVNNVCTIYYSRDASLMIGTIHYKMRMRKPILELLKWQKDKNMIIREISPVHDLTMKQVEKELLALNNYSKGKVMSITLLITKAIGLKTSGPPRKIMPYIYYQFYKFDEHFTKTAFGNDPLFQDVQKFDVLYDNAFHEYIMNNNLELLIMDDSRSLEVEMKNNKKTNTVNLVDTPELDDLIGIVKIPLKDLIVNNIIQNNFPVFNQTGQFAGEIVVNIIWEHVTIENSETQKLPYETKAWEENIVIKLSELIKFKGLNLNSAFEIFDRENKQMISLVNFRDTILFTFNFTNKQHELEQLTQLVFNGKTTLSKLDFYKIFAYLLPGDGIADNLIDTSNTNKNLNNQIVENIAMTIIPENVSPRHHNITNHNFNKSVNQTGYDSQISFRKETNTDFKRDIKINQVPILDSNRTIKEIVGCINEYMIRTKKRQIVEVYKIFDKDGNSFIDKNELAIGFAKLGIPLTHNELEKIWRDIIDKDLRREKIDIKLFKSFYEKYKDKTF